MKAPISERVRRILSNPQAAHELVKQVILSRRTNHSAEIQIGKDRYELVRITGQETTDSRDQE